jgi:arylsulfatase A-like enzyme
VRTAPPRFGCYGDGLAATPDVDQLAGQGVLFESAFSTAPVCAPSRFSLITGVTSESNAPANHMSAKANMPGWMKTYPEIIRGLGYYCINNAKTQLECGHPSRRHLGRIRESTIIIQTSEHGGVNPRSKRYCYDEGLPVPLIIQASGRYQQLLPAPGTRLVSAMSTLSIPPTLIELAGGEIPAYMRAESLVRRSYDPRRMLPSACASALTSAAT